MDKRMVSILCVVIGVIALAISAWRFMNGAGNLQNLIEVLSYSIGGAILFFYGIHHLYEPKNTTVPREITTTDRRA